MREKKEEKDENLKEGKILTERDDGLKEENGWKWDPLAFVLSH